MMNMMALVFICFMVMVALALIGAAIEAILRWYRKRRKKWTDIRPLRNRYWERHPQD